MEGNEGFVERVSRRFPGLAGALERFDARVTAIMVVACVALLLFKKIGSGGFFQGELASEALKTHPRISVLADYYWFTSCFVLLGVAPFVTLWIVDGPTPSAARAGLGLGDWRTGLRWVGLLYAVMLPVVFAVSRSAAFARYYPMNEQLGNQVTLAIAGQGGGEVWPWFLGYELLYVLYFIGWEYFFRGFLLFGLWDRWRFDTILVANIPFVLMHAGKPLPEALGSVVAGFALGLFAWRTRSFWYCWALHALVAVSMDVCAIQRRVELLAAGVQ